MPEAPPDHPVTRLGTLLPGDPLTRVPTTLQRFDVLAGTVRVPALLWTRDLPRHRLLITFNGAVRRRSEKSPEDVFQRRSWVDDIEADVLFISDPTLRMDNAISIGWGQGGRSGYAIPAMAQTAQYVAEALGIGSHDRVYFGTSAGGFQALQAAARDAGSRVLVNNPQIDWTLYAPTSVTTICRHSYAGASPKAITADHPGRTSAARVFAETGYIPPTRYLVNTASKNDAERQLPALLKGLAPTGTGQPPRIDIALYTDPPTGHNPLPKPRTIEEINQFLADED